MIGWDVERFGDGKSIAVQSRRAVEVDASRVNDRIWVDAASTGTNDRPTGHCEWLDRRKDVVLETLEVG